MTANTVFNVLASLGVGLMLLIGIFAEPVTQSGLAQVATFGTVGPAAAPADDVLYSSSR